MIYNACKDLKHLAKHLKFSKTCTKFWPCGYYLGDQAVQEWENSLGKF